MSNNDRFKHAVVVHQKDGKTVLENDDGSYETVVHKDDPEKISVTAVEEDDNADQKE